MISSGGLAHAFAMDAAQSEAKQVISLQGGKSSTSSRTA
jgi:hypothetical protein